MIKNNQFHIVFLVIIVCFVTNSVLSAAISSSRTHYDNDIVRVVTKVGEQTKIDDALVNQQKDSENVAPIDPVLCKVAVDENRNVNAEERIVERNLREGRSPIVAVISVPNGSGKNTAIPVIVLKQNADDNKNVIQQWLDGIMQNIQGLQGLIPGGSSGGIVNPQSSNDAPTDLLGQVGTALTSMQSTFTDALTNIQQSFTQTVSSIQSSFNSAVSNSLNTVQSNNQNILQNLFTTTPKKPSSTETIPEEKPEETPEVVQDELTNNEVAQKVDIAEAATVVESTTKVTTTTSNKLTTTKPLETSILTTPEVKISSVASTTPSSTPSTTTTTTTTNQPEQVETVVQPF